MACCIPKISIRDLVYKDGKEPINAVHIWWNSSLKNGYQKSALREELIRKAENPQVPHAVASAISNFLQSQKASVDA